MKRLIFGMTAALVCLLAGSVGSVSAQVFYPSGIPHYTPPGFNSSGLSPYLNLTRSGDSATNYYLGTIPEFQRRSNYNQLRTAIQETEQRVGAISNEGLEIGKALEQTGHPTAFGYYGSYYPLGGSRSGGASGLARPYR